jgi:hypothetical protein
MFQKYYDRKRKSGVFRKMLVNEKRGKKRKEKIHE